MQRGKKKKGWCSRFHKYTEPDYDDCADWDAADDMEQEELFESW